METRFVYILQSERNGMFYIGSTKNVNQRLKEHNSKQTKSTAKFVPWGLVFCQEFEKTYSYRIEMKLKKLKRRDILEKIIQEKNIKMRP